MALDLSKSLGLPLASGICQERVGVVPWLAKKSGLGGATARGHCKREFR